MIKFFHLGWVCGGQTHVTNPSAETPLLRS